MPRRTASLVLVLLVLTGEALFAGDKPNLVLIVADDLGYGDLGVYGCEDVATPNIDAIASSGVRFTNGYVSCPVCSPTRAGLLTGRYQQRFGHEFNPGPARQAEANFGLPLSETTLADRLKAAGYATGMVGKWHLGYEPQFHPLKRGFDEFFGFLGGAHSYVDAQADARNPILRGTAPIDESEYLTRALAREAGRYIRAQAQKPFFLYLTFNAVHTPMQAPEEQIAKFEGIEDEKRRTLAAMLTELDSAVGSVLTALRETGLEENTLIAFISDNGGPTFGNGSKNGPLSGFKGGVDEGGIRVPFLMQWKSRLPAGTTYEQPVIALDLLPTFVAASGTELPADAAIDGVNLLPHLTGENAQAPHQHLFWRFGEQAAVRSGAWKLMRHGRDTEWQLFNLEDDVAEQNDRAAAEPEGAAELLAAYEEWNATLEQPRWKGRGGRRNRAAAGATP